MMNTQPVIDFSGFIEEKTKDFIGRRWVFEAINNWVAKDKSRIFVLGGDPGTGKSSIAARLAKMSDGIIRDVSFSELKPGCLSYYHFCQFGLESTLSPLTFVQSVSEALANRYPTFRTALESAGSQQNIFNIIQNAETVQSGGQVTGAKVRIEIKGGDARPLFDLAVRRPIQALCREFPTERIAILVDSLDEAITFNAENNIAQLLKLVTDFPPQVRFICTCRSKNERIIDIIGDPTLDLIKNAPPDLDEVKLYAVTRLQTVPEPKCSDTAARIAEKSNGNFLYAYHVLNDLLSQGVDFVDPDRLDLPDKLEDVYRKFIEREMASNATKWNDVYRPLLGLIAVARGNGLTKMQLIGITELVEDTADEVLKVCAQYLVGSQSEDSPYRIYHQSFRDFLLYDKQYTVFPAVRHAAIARYLQEQYGSNWSTCNDEYALRYTPTHWADAATMSKDKRESRIQALIELTQNPKYQRRFEHQIGDIPALKEHLHRAVQVAALSDRDDMLPWLIKASQGYVDFHRDYLQAESVVKLAEEGQLEQAEARLRLFTGIDEDWQIAARLIIAWLGVDRNATAAEQLRARVSKMVTTTEPLPLLLDRVKAALDHLPSFAFEAQPALSLDLGQEVVKRISGQAFNRELLLTVNPRLRAIGQRGPQTEMIAQSGYTAAFDAPTLVNIAREHGVAGTALVDRYIDAHAKYNYVEYRNRSLWIVLQAVLHHYPDQSWVKERLRRILVAALTGGGVDFLEMLPLTVLLLSERATNGDARLTVEHWRSVALRGADELQNRRGADDSWGNHKRRLIGLMELYELLFHDSNTANELLDRIRLLPGGFAGYQSPAHLRLADAARACRMDAPGLVERVMEDALQSAHHIQDYHFCARVTARCNALKRCHQSALNGQELANAILRLAASPADGEFAADHLVHEPYEYRDENAPDILPITNARQAETLEQLVEVFQRPAVEFRRLNPQYGLTQMLDDKTLIRVPDPGFAPLLSVHLGARVVADDSLEDERGALLRALVPVAANNPTALDTVLSYLLIANQPDNVELLKEVARETGPVVFRDMAPPPAQIGPDAAIPA